MKQSIYTIFLSLLYVCAAHAVPADTVGESWMGPSFELDYYYDLDANYTNRGRVGTLRCTVGKKQQLQEADIAAILRPLIEYGELSGWNQMEEKPAEYYRNFALAPKHQLLMYYQDPRVPSYKSFIHDLTKKPQVVAAIEKIAAEHCMRGVKD